MRRFVRSRWGEEMTIRRWLALCGVAWPILIVLAFTVVGGETPNDDASAAKVVSYYRDHKNASMIAALMVTIAAVLLVLFAARLHEVLRGDRSGSGVLPNAAFGGALILASGLLLLAAVHFALVQAADHRFGGPAQTLNVIDGNDFFVLIGGISVLMLASGIATVRRPVLPRWLGWVAIVIGVLSLAGPVGFVGALLFVIWSLVVAILMLVRTNLDAVGGAEVTAASVETS
jgi:Domain of unknown function (DUF4386)